MKVVTKEVPLKEVELLGHKTKVPVLDFEHGGFGVLEKKASTALVFVVVPDDSVVKASSKTVVDKYTKADPTPEVPGLE
jgi:hypothetical protein